MYGGVVLGVHPRAPRDSPNSQRTRRRPCVSRCAPPWPPLILTTVCSERPDYSYLADGQPAAWGDEGQGRTTRSSRIETETQRTLEPVLLPPRYPWSKEGVSGIWRQLPGKCGQGWGSEDLGTAGLQDTGPGGIAKLSSPSPRRLQRQERQSWGSGLSLSRLLWPRGQSGSASVAFLGPLSAVSKALAPASWLSLLTQPSSS